MYDYFCLLISLYLLAIRCQTNCWYKGTTQQLGDSLWGSYDASVKNRIAFSLKVALRMMLQVLMLDMLKVGFSFLRGRDDCDEVISGWCRA